MNIRSAWAARQRETERKYLNTNCAADFEDRKKELL